MEKAVFTDIDGTLLKGFITIDFVKFLYEKQLFDEVAYSKQNELMKEYKNGKIAYVPWLKEWENIWAFGLNGKKQKNVLLAAKEFFPSFRSRVYASSIDLVKRLHEKGYLVIGVSVGAIEAINLIKDYLGLDYAFGSELLVNRGVYSSKVISTMHTEDGKLKTIINFSSEKKIDLGSSIGMGDTSHDLQMLDLVGKKVALNPDEAMLRTAKERGFLTATHENILEKIEQLL